MSMLLPETEPGGMLSLARLIAQAGDMGWDWFDQLPGGKAKSAAEAGMEIAASQRLAQACARLADNPDFVLMLEHLVAVTILQPPQFQAPSLTIDQTALLKAAHDAECALVWRLLKLVREGRSMPLARAQEEKTDASEVQPVGDGAAKPAGRRRRRG